MFAADEQKFWLGNDPKLVFYSSNISTSTVAWPTSTLAGAAMGGMKVNVINSTGTATVIIPFFNVASS
jgi:hypothetical protein